MLTLALQTVHHAMCRVMELRIDVNHEPEELAGEFDSIYDRMNRPRDRLHQMPEVKTDIPGLVLRYREADGEYYVYLVDVVRKRLAGYTVFNRLIELGRGADPYARAPHSKYAAPYQGCGLASSVYRWALDAGLCLMSGARQSTGAHALWLSLAKDYELGYVDLRRKRLSYLGTEVSEAVLNDLHTRMMMLGRGWNLERYAALTGMGHGTQV